MHESNLRGRASVLLKAIAKTPRMYASCQEAFISHVCGILIMYRIDYPVNKFYEWHLQTNGPMWINLLEPVDDEWAKLVIDNALESLNYE